MKDFFEGKNAGFPLWFNPVYESKINIR